MFDFAFFESKVGHGYFRVVAVSNTFFVCFFSVDSDGKPVEKVALLSFNSFLVAEACVTGLNARMALGDIEGLMDCLHRYEIRDDCCRINPLERFMW